jgi:hypothetical protein
MFAIKPAAIMDTSSARRPRLWVVSVAVSFLCWPTRQPTASGRYAIITLPTPA